MAIHLKERATLLRVVGTGFRLTALIGGVIGVGMLRVPSELAATLNEGIVIRAIYRKF